jgi:protein gp37
MNRQGKNGIEWTDYTWSPITGCEHGCEYCYARKQTVRFGGSCKAENCTIAPACGNDTCKNCQDYTQINKLHVLEDPRYIFYPKKRIDPYPYGFEPTFHKYRLDEPRKKTKSKKIFVVSMGDLFGEWIPAEWIEKVFDACEAAPQHTYMFLTKNPSRYEKVYSLFPEEAHCLYGTTITCQDDIKKIPNNIKPFIDFISVEPLIGEINIKDILYWELMHYSYIPGECVQQPDYETMEMTASWVIIGAQTGPGAIKPNPEWIQSIVEQCRAAGVPVFMKNSLKPYYWEGELIQEWPEGLK